MPDRDGKPLHSAGSLKELYEAKGTIIFQKTLWKKLRSVSGFLDVEYCHKQLEDVINQYLGDTTLQYSITKSLITSYELENRKPFVFRSWEQMYKGVKMKDAARATSAAPAFFEPAILDIEGVRHTLIDGGVFLNNPALSAYLEAIRIFPAENEFLLVSLGTGENTRPITFEEARDWGKIDWAIPIFDVIFDGLNDAIDYHLKNILGNNYYRFQNKLLQQNFEMDIAPQTENQINSIVSESRELIKNSENEIEELCGKLV